MMELYIADAFTNQLFGGNPAGVVLLPEGGDFPEASLMQAVAAELKHSETAFVKPDGPNRFRLRYFTPVGEVALCGHATIAAFTVLRDEKGAGTGAYVADTRAGALHVTVEPDTVWLEMAPGRLLKTLSDTESAEVYQAYGLTLQDRPEGMRPCIVSTGLSDILLPVGQKEALERAVQNRDEVIRISKLHQTVGVHMFFPEASPDVTARCRNFAPLYGIDEEAATGTANGALTYRLFMTGLLGESGEAAFIQGEQMGRPSMIRGRIAANNAIYIGGNAVISVSGCLRI